VLFESMPKAFRPVSSLTSNGNCAVPRRTATLLTLLAGLLWLITAALSNLGQSGHIPRDSASLEARRPVSEALQLQASTAWRETSVQRKDSGRGRPQSKTTVKVQLSTLLAASSPLRPQVAPRCVSQSFLICRTRNPRDPPAA
jgi:hypothetical protein